ncbi:hypothetical protein V6Z12_D07G066600 [Gossypium hirsutum]
MSDPRKAEGKGFSARVSTLAPSCRRRRAHREAIANGARNQVHWRRRAWRAWRAITAGTHARKGLVVAALAGVECY